jgi:hypothetical protein
MKFLTQTRGPRAGVRSYSRALLLGFFAWSACASPRTPESVGRAPRPGGHAVSGAAGNRIDPGSALFGGSMLGSSYQAHLERHPDLTYDKLARELRLPRAPDRPLSFDPTKLAFYDEVSRALQLTPEEGRAFKNHGVVSVDHEQRYSMGAAYFGIYARDLPVLITTDSILHALHRSYDQILKQLEVGLFTATIREALRSAHDELPGKLPELASPKLRQSAEDVDLYLTVARNLLEGAGASTQPAAPLPIAPKLEQTGKVAALLGAVASLNRQTTRLNGGARPIDYSQFRPRGHYTETEPLKSYFRALMWLGRADVGFVLDRPHPRSGLEVDVERERRGAALLSILLRDGKQLPRLVSMSHIVDFMVGRADNITPFQMAHVLDKEAPTVSKLDDVEALARIRRALSALAPGQQQVRSQLIVSPRDEAKEVAAPQILQLFGQRFTPDSFALSRVVYDSIHFRSQKPERLIPRGLDVMAALGNDEAVGLLRPELEKYQYSSNLLALRRAINEQPAEEWRKNLYVLWLDALRTLDDKPESVHFPEVMQRSPWRRKQLQTQLASWTELRHDTILYTKQSYSAVPGCVYPDAYVEPYPEFFDRVAWFAERGAALLAGADVSADSSGDADAERNRQVSFLKGFANTARMLERLAKKELAAKPFSDDERRFLEKTIDIRGLGSGAPRYDGWYPQLIYGGAPADWKPVVADVHTSGGSDTEPPLVLEEGVGDVEFLLVAIDNESDRGVYVGPVFSYYELTVDPGDRLTDEEWQRRIIEGKLPARPAWTDIFRAPAKYRDLGPSRDREDAPEDPEEDARR